MANENGQKDMTDSINDTKHKVENVKKVKKIWQIMAKLMAIPILKWIIIILLIIVILVIFLVGIWNFFTTMPNLVKDYVKQFVTSIYLDLFGQAQIGTEQFYNSYFGNGDMIKLANYMESAGIDLEDQGFLSRDHEDYINRNDDGTIASMKSKYLAAYLAADARGYLVDNQKGIPSDVQRFWLFV